MTEVAAEAGAPPVPRGYLVAQRQVAVSGGSDGAGDCQPVQRSLPQGHQYGAHGPQLPFCQARRTHQYLDRHCASKSLANIVLYKVCA